MEAFSSFYLLLLIIPILLPNAQSQTAQPPTAAAVTPPPPPAAAMNVTAVLEKGGQFRTLMQLLQSTQLDQRIDAQLNNSNAGITIFAPSDNAFSALPPGTLNTLSSQQQVTLLQFHVIPTLITLPQFQTVSNPVSTEAGNSAAGEYPLNVTTAGNQVNISTGIVNTTVAGTVYSGSQLAVYQVDKVLLPLGIFRPSVPAPPPAKAPKNASAPAEGPASKTPTESADVPSAGERRRSLGVQFAVAAVGFFLCWGF